MKSSNVFTAILLAASIFVVGCAGQNPGDFVDAVTYDEVILMTGYDSYIKPTEFNDVV